MHLNRRAKLVLGGAVVAIGIIVGAFVLLTPGEGPSIEKVLTPTARDEQPSVLNIESGEFVPIEQALSNDAPFIRLIEVGAHRTSGGLLTALAKPEYTYSAYFHVSRMDLDFVPLDAWDKPLRNYWADADDSTWPKVTPRQTLSYGWEVRPVAVDCPMFFRTLDGTTGLLRIAELDESGARVRYRIVRGPKRVADPNQRVSNEQYIGRLPEGLGVELIGISQHPSDGALWWRPDGRRLRRPPYLNARSAIKADAGMAAYEIAFRWVSCRPGQVHGSRITVPAALGEGSVVPHDEFGGPSITATGSAYLLPKEATSTTVEFGLATGDWQTALTTHDSERTASLDSHRVTITAPRQIRRKILVEVVLSSDWAQEYAWRFVAVHRKGDIFMPLLNRKVVFEVDSTGREQQRHAYRLQVVPLLDIKEFRFEICPYRWIQFKRVSLRPDEGFDFEIEVPAHDRADPNGTAASQQH